MQYRKNMIQLCIIKWIVHSINEYNTFLTNIPQQRGSLELTTEYQNVPTQVTILLYCKECECTEQWEDPMWKCRGENIFHTSEDLKMIHYLGYRGADNI